MLEQYLATLPPMQAGKARKALDRYQGFNGELQKRYLHAERLAPLSATRIDRDKSRLYTSENTFFSFPAVTLAFVDYVEWLQGNR